MIAVSVNPAGPVPSEADVVILSQDRSAEAADVVILSQDRSAEAADIRNKVVIVTDDREFYLDHLRDIDEIRMV